MNTQSKRRGKLLCSSERYELYCTGCVLTACFRNNEKRISLGALPVPFCWAVLSHVRLFTRLLRLEPRCGLFLDEDRALICCRGGLYLVSLPESSIREEHRFRPGMSSPLALTLIRGNSGFTDCVLYGDYVNDGADNEIRIFRRSLHAADWAPVFSFAAGRVKHIHSIHSCPWRESLIVFTGDKDRESGIWEIAKGFSGLRQIIGGSQQFRAVAGFVTQAGIVYATDAPNELNSLFFCDYDGGNRRKLSELAGPAIYGAELRGGRYVFSTSVEPAREDGFLSWFSNRRGHGIADTRSHVYLVEENLQVKEIFSGKKDWLPMRLFGYGTFQFPHGLQDGIAIVGQSLWDLDGRTILVEE